MRYEEEENESKAYTNFRTSLDFFMGVMYSMVGIYVFKNPVLLKQFGGLSPNNIYIVASLFCLYGVFRITRGYFALRRSTKKRR